MNEGYIHVELSSGTNLNSADGESSSESASSSAFISSEITNNGTVA